MAHLFEPSSGRFLEAAHAVHRSLGPGFLESTYHAALVVALEHRGICYASQVPIAVRFEGVVVGEGRIDLIVERQIVVELKAVATFSPVHFAQVRSYLRATGLRTGLLCNFNSPTLTVKRIVLG